MNDFFSHLNQQRLLYLHGQTDDSYLMQASRLYSQLMETKIPFALPLQRELEQFLANPPAFADHLLHYLWVINGYARYLCFVTKDYSRAHAMILLALSRATGLDSFRYQEFDSEIKCFPFILALNIARLSTHAGSFSLAEKQFQELSRFLMRSENELKSFPPAIRQRLNESPKDLRELLNPESLEYLQQKIQAGEQTLRQKRSS